MLSFVQPNYNDKNGKTKQGILKNSRSRVNISTESSKDDPKRVPKIVRVIKTRSNNISKNQSHATFQHDDVKSEKMKKFRDYADLSIHPSYNILNISYDLICHQRYLETKRKYDKQFMFELNNLIDCKTVVGEQYFTRSFLSYSTLWPPLHTKPEIDYFYKKFFQLKPEQKKRLNYLMTTDIKQ